MSFCRVGYETTIGNHQTGFKQKNTWFEWSLGSLLSYPRTVTMFRSHQTIRLRLQIGTILRSQTPFPGQHVTQLVGLESAFHFWWKWNMGLKKSSKVDKYHHGSQKWNQQISPKIDCDHAALDHFGTKSLSYNHSLQPGFNAASSEAFWHKSVRCPKRYCRRRKR